MEGAATANRCILGESLPAIDIMPLQHIAQILAIVPGLSCGDWPSPGGPDWRRQPLTASFGSLRCSLLFLRGRLLPVFHGVSQSVRVH